MSCIHPFECDRRRTGLQKRSGCLRAAGACRKEPRYNAGVLFLALAVTVFLQMPTLVSVAMQTAAPQAPAPETPAQQAPAPLEPAPGNGVVVISTSLGDVFIRGMGSQS